MRVCVCVYVSRTPNVQGSSTTRRTDCNSFMFLENYLDITLSLNNRVTLCSYNVHTITYKYIQLFTTSCVFSTIVQSYVTQWQGAARRSCNCQYYVAISTCIPRSHQDIDWQHQIPMLYFCATIFFQQRYHDSHLRTTKLRRPEDGFFYSSICIKGSDHFVFT